MIDTGNRDPWEEASAAIEALRAALHAHGITLPDLSLNLPSVMAGYPLINLGEASAETVRQIAEALSRAAA